MNDLFDQHPLAKERSQCGRLYRWMKQGHKVTSLDAWKRLGIARLSSRIHELKADGLPVRDKWIEVTNQFGEVCKVKEFWMN